MINNVFEQRFMPLTYCVVTLLVIFHETFDPKLSTVLLWKDFLNLVHSG